MNRNFKKNIARAIFALTGGKIHAYHHDIKEKNILANDTSKEYKPTDGLNISIGMQMNTIQPSSEGSVVQRVDDDGNRRYHSLTTRLTGNDISVGDNWQFIEPRFSLTNVNPGEAYMSKGMRDIKPRNIILDSDRKSGHTINNILTGNDLLTSDDWNWIEPQTDKIEVQPGEAYKSPTDFGTSDTPIYLIGIQLDKREQILYDVTLDDLTRSFVDGLSGRKSSQPYARERYVAPGISHIPEPLESRTQYLARRAVDPTSMKIDVEYFAKKNKPSNNIGFGAA